jgi:small subunit ribosomal protein S16
MPTKIRLQRKGKKGQPFYHIVIADGRAPRDGKSIEKIGTYNPLTKPADINFDFDRALYWLQAGAQPTDTVRAILSFKGVLYKNHLAIGVKKGALTQEQADAKFDAWVKDKQAKIENKLKESESTERNEAKDRLDAEKKVNEARMNEIAAKRAAELKAKMKVAEDKAAAAAVAEGETLPEAVQVEAEAEIETPAEEPIVVAEEKAEEKVEEPEAEAKEEEKAGEVKEEPTAEAKAEEVKEEEKTEEKAEDSKDEEKKAE